MNDDYVNEQFRNLAFTTIALDAESLIDQVIRMEAESRHEMACNQDPEAAGARAHEAYSLFMEGTTLATLPTLIMGMADKFNREHEAYLAALDALADAKEHMRQAQVFAERGNHQMVNAEIVAASAILEDALENAVYSKIGDGDEPDHS